MLPRNAVLSVYEQAIEAADIPSRKRMLLKVVFKPSEDARIA